MLVTNRWTILGDSKIASSRAIGDWNIQLKKIAIIIIEVHHYEYKETIKSTPLEEILIFRISQYIRSLREADPTRTVKKMLTTPLRSSFLVFQGAVSVPTSRHRTLPRLSCLFPANISH